MKKIKRVKKCQYVTIGIASAICSLIIIGTGTQIVEASMEVSKTELDNVTGISIEYAELPAGHGIVLEEKEPLNPIVIPEIENTEVSVMAQEALTEAKEDRNYIMVGDSRTVGMQDLLPEEIQVIAEVGRGYNWLSNTVDQDLKSEITDNTTVLFNLGVNDLGNINKYMEYLDDLKSEFPETEIVCMTVGPVGKTTVTNDQILSYNQVIRQSDYEILDVNDALNEAGFGTVDGLHYNRETYQKISDLVTDYCNL